MPFCVLLLRSLTAPLRASPNPAALAHAPLSWQRHLVGETSASRGGNDYRDPSHDAGDGSRDDGERRLGGSSARGDDDDAAFNAALARPCYGSMVANFDAGNMRGDRTAAVGLAGAVGGAASFDPNVPTADPCASRRALAARGDWGSSYRGGDGAGGGDTGRSSDGGAGSMAGPLGGRHAAASDSDAVVHEEAKASAAATPWLVRTVLPAPLWDDPALTSEDSSPAERHRRIVAQPCSWKPPVRRFTDGDTAAVSVSVNNFNERENAETPRRRVDDSDASTSPRGGRSRQLQRQNSQHQAKEVVTRRIIANEQAATSRRGSIADDRRRPPPLSILDDKAASLPSLMPPSASVRAVSTAALLARRASNGRAGVLCGSSSPSQWRDEGSRDGSNLHTSPVNVRVLPLTGGFSGGMHAPGRRPSIRALGHGLGGAHNGGGGGGGDRRGAWPATSPKSAPLRPLGSVSRGAPDGGAPTAEAAVNRGSDVETSAVASPPPPPLSMCFGASGGADMIAAIANAQKQKRKWHVRTTAVGGTPDLTQRRQTADS